MGKTTGLKEGLDNVKRCSDTGGKCTSKTTGHTVGERVIFSLRVHNLREGLVRDKLGGCEGHGHAEGGRVGDVEGLEAFGAVEGFGALHQGLVDGAVDLHTLLDH